MEKEIRNALRSKQNPEKAYVRFWNKSGRTVEVIWIDFSGQYIRYRHLMNYEFVDIDTFKHHPWLALDILTKDRMNINKRFVYYPKVNLARRSLAVITLPLYSLRYRALLEVRNCLKESKDVDRLDLPGKLNEDLKSAINLRNNCVVEPHLRLRL